MKANRFTFATDKQNRLQTNVATKHFHDLKCKVSLECSCEKKED